MKERFKMIFDRIDIFVICIVVSLCLGIVEGFIENWDVCADFVFVAFLVSEVCYTSRCNERLEKELVKANQKLKDAESKVKKSQYEVIAEQEKYTHWMDVNERYFRIVQLCRDLWQERCHLEEAKVLLCKKKLTTGGFLEQIKTREEAIADIENKIRQANIEYNKFRNQH